MNTNMVTYYKDRAAEYEKIYFKPERQDDLQASGIFLQDIFKGRHVLEIACGTGYWTEKIAHSAASIFATDINEAVLAIARRKEYTKAKINFGIVDFYNFPTYVMHECLFGGFIWSHIKLEDLDKFLEMINNVVQPGGTVVIMDNIYVDGNSYPVTYSDEAGNTYQARKLDDGSDHLVVKNFPCEEFLRSKLKGRATDIKYIGMDYYWILTYKTPAEVRNHF